MQTIRYLKPSQLYYQIYYRLKSKLGIRSEGQIIIDNCEPLQFPLLVYNAPSFSSISKFTFLNQSHLFDEIDWNFNEYGKLWTYNLNYFDFLNQKSCNKEDGIRLIKDFISKYDEGLDCKEPYPASLRIINWIKFISRYDIKDVEVDRILARDVYRLTKTLEYHILANHLLENIFALLFASYYFKNDALYTFSKKHLVQQLDEQILPDGAHYELAPMYHQLILFRVLDSFHLLTGNAWKEDDLSIKLRETAEKMLSWMDNISFRNGDIPMVNDSTFEISHTFEDLLYYSNMLHLKASPIPLDQSGYRMMKTDRCEVLVDVGNIRPTYQPGHSHADSFNFLMHIDEKPFLVDTGISTYEVCTLRSDQRSSRAHNTVTINDENSSNVWSSFRVGRRAEVTLLKDASNEIQGRHNGYRHLGSEHTRLWRLGEGCCEVIDKIQGKRTKGKAYLHFHPNIRIYEQSKTEVKTNLGTIEFVGSTSVFEKEYEMALGFNKTCTSTMLEVEFEKELTTKIKFLSN